MIDISVRGLRKSFEVNNWILDGLSFDINSGERVGLLGKNGAGKTTLFRLLTGELTEDEGEIVTAPGKRMGLISQIPHYPDGYTAGDVLRSAFARLYDIQERMEQLTEKMSVSADASVLAEYDRLSAAFETQGGYETDYELERVANGLEIPESMREQPFESLSGGEKTRVNLARLILEKTEILLLDEPTNHLDLRATEWLEDYLLKFKGTVLAISHDRFFLDRAIQRIIELSDGKAEFYSGNYSFYVTEKKRRFDEKLKQYEKSQAKVEQLERAVAQMRLWAFLGNDKLFKRAFSMEKRMDRLQTAEKPKIDKKIKAKFGVRQFFGDEVLVMDGITKRFADRTLFSDVDLELLPQERIALIGDNGAGKTTLIKLIMGELEPDRGYLYRGPSVKLAYLPQIMHFEEPQLSVLETVMYEAKCTQQSARNRLAAYLFTGEDVFKPVSTLSGGEQSRLRLCILMREDINLLILDEPTNHLDIASREWMEAALADYNEAMLFVSHDRFFIERFANRIWELKNGAITDFPGGFAEYREYLERQNSLQQTEKKAARKHEGKKKPAPSPEKLIAKLERDIAKSEEVIAELDQQMLEFSSDYEKLLELGEKRAELEAGLEKLYEEWSAASSL